MSERAERLLREAVQDLAGTPHPPPDFVATAIRQGRRMRRRRQVIAAAAAVVAVGAIVAPYVWLRPDPGPPALSIGGPPATTASTGVPTPSPGSLDTWRDGPVPLPGGALLLSAGSSSQAGPTWVYDPTERRYVSIPATYTGVRAAPRRGLAAVGRRDRPTEVGLYDLATGKAQWVETGGTVISAEWSPDGRRLLLTLQDTKSEIHLIGLLTPGAGLVKQYPVKVRSLSCAGPCRFSWLPNGKEVALAQTEPFVARPGTVTPSKIGLQVFMADTGIPSRFLPVQGAVVSSSAWSPDGTFVVVSGQPDASARGNPTARDGKDLSGQSGGRPVPQLVSVQSGEVLRELPSADVTWVTPRRLLYLDTEGRPGTVSAVLVDVDGAEIERSVLPLELVSSDDIVVAAR